jgi:tetratricopeptide (TPR) repeat protein
MKLFIFTLILIIAVSPRLAQVSSNPREQIKQYVADLQKNPTDQVLREKIIRLALTLDPKPATPEEAKRFLARGLAAAEEAKEAKDFKDAAAEFEKASLAAPWLGEPYRALGVVQDKAGNYSEAKRNLKLYLLTEPEQAQVEKAKELIYKIEYKEEAQLRESVRKNPNGFSAAELTFWNSIKDSESAGDFRAYLDKYPNGEFAGLAKNRLAPLEAAEKEKQKAAENERERVREIARRTKTFEGSFGVALQGDFKSLPGKLFVSPTKIQFVWDLSNLEPHDLQCANFAKAAIDDAFIREIRGLDFSDEEDKAMTKSRCSASPCVTGRFKAESPADATSALEAIREVCKKSLNR